MSTTTLDAARRAFHVIEQCDPDVLLSETSVSLGIIGDYLAEQVSHEVLKIEKLKNENTELRNLFERLCVDTARESLTALRINLAISRGHLPVDFAAQLEIWSK